MDSAKIASIVSAIPERAPRVLTGTAFRPREPGASPQDSRIAYLCGFLQWLTPLNAITKDDQRVLGLLAAAEKAAQHYDEDDDAGRGEAESALLR
ncbi:MAG TPA: hypothetical protein VFX09_01770 [Burkholderiales bacterium]|nr:hypothetical protein [Burkholderiales bacterium]